MGTVQNQESVVLLCTALLVTFTHCAGFQVPGTPDVRPPYLAHLIFPALCPRGRLSSAVCRLPSHQVTSAYVSPHLLHTWPTLAHPSGPHEMPLLSKLCLGPYCLLLPRPNSSHLNTAHPSLAIAFHRCVHCLTLDPERSEPGPVSFTV